MLSLIKKKGGTNSRKIKSRDYTKNKKRIAADKTKCSSSQNSLG